LVFYTGKYTGPETRDAAAQAAELAEVALSESSESFLDAESDEFFDVYSDEFFDCVDPMSRAGSSRRDGVFRLGPEPCNSNSNLGVRDRVLGPGHWLATLCAYYCPDDFSRG